MVREHQIVESDRVVELLIVRSLKWELAAKQGKQKNAEGPDIRRRARILHLGHNFGGHVRRCPAEKLDLLVMRQASREAEVDQFDALLGLI